MRYSRERNTSTGEEGAYLVLAAVIFGVLLFVGTFGLNIGQVTGLRRDMRRAAELATMSGIALMAQTTNAQLTASELESHTCEVFAKNMMVNFQGTSAAAGVSHAEWRDVYCKRAFSSSTGGGRFSTESDARVSSVKKCSL